MEDIKSIIIQVGNDFGEHLELWKGFILEEATRELRNKDISIEDKEGTGVSFLPYDSEGKLLSQSHFSKIEKKRMKEKAHSILTSAHFALAHLIFKGWYKYPEDMDIVSIP